MASTWRQTEKANRRARYLQVAARLFAERGFNGVSIDDLGAAAGVSGPALYRHFAGKEAVLTELLVDASERLVVGCAATLAEFDEPGAQENGTPRPAALEAALGALVAFHIDFALAERDIIRIQDRELASLPEEANRRVRRLQRSYVRSWITVVAALRPDRTEEETRLRVQAVFGLLNSTPFSAEVGDDERARPVLATMAIAALLQPIPATAASPSRV